MSLNTLVILFVGNFFLFIVSLICAQASFFEGRWKWFWLKVACVIISGTCLFIVGYVWLGNSGSSEPPIMLVRPPTTPL